MNVKQCRRFIYRLRQQKVKHDVQGMISIILIALSLCVASFSFGALTLLVGRQEEHPAHKKQFRGAGTVICLE